MLHRWSLPGLRVVEQLPVTGRNVNTVLVDDRGERYLLREHRRNPDPRRIAFQLDFQEHLGGRGIPTAPIIAASNGERIVDERFVLFGHVDGTPYSYGSRARVAAAARCLAELHAATEDFDAPEFADDTIPDIRGWWLRGRSDLDDLHAMFDGRGVDPELEFLEGWWADLLRAVPSVEHLPTGWVHGDFHGGNLAFAGDRVVGVFDFDVVHRGLRLVDAAYAIFCFGRADTGSTHVRRGWADPFVDELTDAERAVLPAFVVAVHARTAARYRIREREGGDPAEVLRGHVARMRALSGLLSR